LLSLKQDHKDAAKLAQEAWAWLEMQGQLLVKDGQTIERKEDNLRELKQQAQTFLDNQLPILRSAGIA